MMNTHWQTFLSSQNLLNHPPLNAKKPSLSFLSHLGFLKVSGDDAETFLQGQLTNDVTLLNENNSQLAAICTPKGRILAIFRLFKQHNDFYLQLPLERLPIILKRLKMFVLMSQVEIIDCSESHIAIGLSDISDDLNLIIPSQADQVIQQDHLTLIRVAGEPSRMQIITDIQSGMNQCTDWADKVNMTDEHYWRWLEIKAGLPQVFNATAEAFVPQMMNLDKVNGLSFTKGCYTGQEVVSRMHYLGKAKRQMYQAHINDLLEIAIGTPLYSSESQSAQGAGKVVDAQQSPAGGMDLLVVAEIKQATANNLQLNNENGAKLMIQTLS